MLNIPTIVQQSGSRCISDGGQKGRANKPWLIAGGEKATVQDNLAGFRTVRFSVVFPGGNGKIVFSNGLQIVAMNADGSEQTKLTDNSAFDSWPAWSPDGSQIAFSRTGIGGGLYIMNADGSDPTFLDGGSHPAWSPDGTKM